MFDIIQAIILGIVQALTEFIPISSSAHLIIAEHILQADFATLAYDVALHLGTLLALLLYFRSDIARFVRGAWQPGLDRTMLMYIIVASIPAAVAGYFFVDIVETVFRSLWIIVVMLVAVAGIMFVADRYKGERTLETISLKEAFLIGCAQALALIPGTSRSGSTIVAGSLLGFNNAEAARFSFYMAIPIIAGANMRVLLREGVINMLQEQWVLYLIGAAVAAAIGCGIIAVLLRYLRTHSLAVFAWYRIVLALVLVVVLVV